jgi:hypothetical protein
VDQINVVHNRAHFQTSVDTVMNLWAAYKLEYFLITQVITCCLYGASVGQCRMLNIKAAEESTDKTLL